MAVASLVLGIITIVLAFIPFLNMICPITGMLAIVFGIINLCKNKENAKKFSKPVVGILLASLSIIIVYFTMIFYGIIGAIIFDEIDNGNNYQYIYKTNNSNNYNNYYNNYYKNNRKR